MTQFKSRNITRMTILAPSTAILDSGGHIFFWKSFKSLLFSSYHVVCHVCVMFCQYWAYLTQFRSNKFTRMPILGQSVAILDSVGHLVSLEIIQIISISYLLVVWHVCVMFCPDWAYLTQIRSQNITQMTIIGLSAAILVSGGHFVSLEIIQIITFILVIGSVTCLCHVRSRLGLVGRI